MARQAARKTPLDDSTGDAIALIGTRVRDVRTAQGMPLRALADRTGLSMSMLSLVERGKTSPSNGVLLCRSCHNMKSSGLVDYEVEDGVVKWRTPDGMVVTSYPAGVGRMFARTYHLRRRKQQERRQGRLVPELPPPF